MAKESINFGQIGIMWNLDRQFTDIILESFYETTNDKGKCELIIVIFFKK